MLEIADRPIPELVKALARHGVEAGYLVPTETALKKSIMDAHALVRDYLRAKGVHDYDQQAKGPEAKREVAATFFTPGGLVPGGVPATTSLYRPQTKDGDPRIWISRLGSRASPGNVIALVVAGDDLVIANLSDRAVVSDDYELSPAFAEAIAPARASNPHADRLLGLIRDISAQGYVDALRHGPTGVGFTLETMLGIQANSSRAPDYFGIELKASRSMPKMRNNRITLFSKVPDWANSPCRSGTDILRRHGYERDGRLQLYCSLKNTPNSLGHFLRVDGDADRLRAMHAAKEPPPREQEVVNWDLGGLRSSLAAKHKETFWVKAKARRTSNGGEQFHFHEVHHTQAPLTLNLGEMLDAGRIELDYAMHLKNERARDHGYLFKIFPDDMVALFPPPIVHVLA